MSQVKGIPLKRVFPGAIGLYLEFFTEADADRFYQQGINTKSRVERIDHVTVVMKHSAAVLAELEKQSHQE
ncbi:MAG: hypothetical protein HC895_06640 [Leptolyngbyaceae cyanobacterium SM1_3_5]|nr:hypothetical protein [Leptolyngbyaceae cyanobacterium SM1_3_5]